MQFNLHLRFLKPGPQPQEMQVGGIDTNLEVASYSRATVNKAVFQRTLPIETSLYPSLPWQI
jgi:hypothetical protein